MKLINLALISACALISTVKSTDSFITALYNSAVYLAANYNSEDLWGGFVLGLQYDNTDDTTDCYTGYQDLYTDISELPDFITAMASEPDVAADNSIIYQLTDNPYLMPGVYFKIAKRAGELGLVAFQFYE